MEEDKKIEVIIDGRNFTVVGGENEDYVRDLAYYVDKNIRKLTSKNESLSQPMAAILAALNIADEFYKTKEKLEGLENKAKDPLEKYDEVCEKLEKSKLRIEELEKENQELGEVLKKWNKEETKLLDEIKGLKSNNESLSNKTKESQDEVKVLQDKNFQDQITLVELKKELNEYIRLLDKETSTINDRKDNKKIE